MDSLCCCSFSHQQQTSVTHVYYHNWGASVKPDNLGNQRGVRIAASFGSPDRLYFFTTHFRVCTLREPALYRGVNINAGSEGGIRQELDDTSDAVDFIISATNQTFLREFCGEVFAQTPVISDIRRVSLFSSTPQRWQMHTRWSWGHQCDGNVSSANGVSCVQTLDLKRKMHFPFLFLQLNVCASICRMMYVQSFTPEGRSHVYFQMWKVSLDFRRHY